MPITGSKTTTLFFLSERDLGVCSYYISIFLCLNYEVPDIVGVLGPLLFSYVFRVLVLEEIEFNELEELFKSVCKELNFSSNILLPLNKLWRFAL